MGNCQTSYIATNTTIFQMKQALHQVFSCPQGHSLAFFQTQTCQSCQSGKAKAIINCISCSYSLCLSCFDRRLETLRKNQLSDGKRFKKLMHSLKAEKQQEQWTSATRLEAFIRSKTETDRNIRVENVPISLQQSVKIRTTMVVEYGLTKTITS